MKQMSLLGLPYHVYKMCSIEYDVQQMFKLKAKESERDQVLTLT